MKTEAEAQGKPETKVNENLGDDRSDRSDSVGASLGVNEFIDIIRETNDEVQQVEEIRAHVGEMKEDLIRYFTDIVDKYELELKVPAESFNPKEMGGDNLKTVFVNELGIISYNFKDGSVKSYRLSDYQPAELMTIFGVVMPCLKDALRAKRKEYEEISNRLSKIRKYLTLLKDKLKGPQKQATPPIDKL